MKRTYTKSRRAEAETETRQRIVLAAVDLHARHGALGTSFAMIAERAGVSPQTVYNHFPHLGALIPNCTGHVMAQAPPVDVGCFADAAAAQERLRRLAVAVYRQTEFMAPWLRLGWGEAQSIPELREVFAQGQAHLRDLLRAAVGRRVNDAFLDAALVLLDYPAWQSLTRQRTSARAAAIAGDALAALLDTLSPQTRKDSP
jgi:AcrR family transcriptional regulator